MKWTFFLNKLSEDFSKMKQLRHQMKELTNLILNINSRKLENTTQNSKDTLNA